MLSWLMHGFSGIFSVVTWVLLVASVVGTLVFFALRKWLPALFVTMPWLIMAQFATEMVLLAALSFKIAVFVTYLLTAQRTINDLQTQLKRKDDQIGTLQATATRKDTQQVAVTTGDKQIDTRYVTQYRTIESIRTVPDLTLANKLATSLTTNFYDTEGNDATPAQ